MGHQHQLLQKEMEKEKELDLVNFITVGDCSPEWKNETKIFFRVENFKLNELFLHPILNIL